MWQRKFGRSPGRLLLESYLNKTMRIVMTDGRSLMGIFWCTDRDANVILGNCMEHMPPREDGSRDEPRPLGLAMIPGRHIVTMHLDQLQHVQPDHVT
ncbi:N-alpha-acetyltransferase 38, NatC auxiliary subunit-like isoform X4 [Pollicipes pollicipes]|uniref:N-alpha-acetyltransferase 38, NatC auxiliary subunit-like isoform X4 n=1 Tax=Pollicipes pollicipes TaxID=41117 RepID=UPI001884F392|nr:N-alpha-acetyltransferase 38, NatC auxiliary subunit-like isoform X4 [Pollicipes pollicipes]